MSKQVQQNTSKTMLHSMKRMPTVGSSDPCSIQALKTSHFFPGWTHGRHHWEVTSQNTKLPNPSKEAAPKSVVKLVGRSLDVLITYNPIWDPTNHCPKNTLLLPGFQGFYVLVGPWKNGSKNARFVVQSGTGFLKSESFDGELGFKTDNVAWFSAQKPGDGGGNCGYGWGHEIFMAQKNVQKVDFQGISGLWISKISRSDHLVKGYHCVPIPAV